VEQLVPHNTAQSLDTGEINIDLVTHTSSRPPTWTFPRVVQDMQCALEAPEIPFTIAYGDGAHESCECDETSCVPVQESPGMTRLWHELLQHGIRPVYGCQSVSGMF